MTDSPDRRRPRSILRPIADVRQFPAFAGIVQIFYGLVPALKFDGGLYYALLQTNNLGRAWGWAMILSGIYLVAGALMRRRETLHIALFLAALLWSAMMFLLADVWLSEFAYMGVTRRWVVPGMLMMPAMAFFLWFCLFREMLMCPVQIPDRRGRS